LIRIQHVAINVTSEEVLAEAEEFYKTLGGIPLSRPPMLEQDTPGRWLAFGETQLHLLVGEPLPKGAHFALHAGERFDEILQTLVAMGAKMRSGRLLWGSRRCFVTDPAGNQIELFEDPPPSDPL